MPIDPDRLRQEQADIAVSARRQAIGLLSEGNLAEAVRFMDMAARNGMPDDEAYDLLGGAVLNLMLGQPPLSS